MESLKDHKKVKELKKELIENYRANLKDETFNELVN